MLRNAKRGSRAHMIHTISVPLRIISPGVPSTAAQTMMSPSPLAVSHGQRRGKPNGRAQSGRSNDVRDDPGQTCNQRPHGPGELRVRGQNKGLAVLTFLGAGWATNPPQCPPYPQPRGRLGSAATRTARPRRLCSGHNRVFWRCCRHPQAIVGPTACHALVAASIPVPIWDRKPHCSTLPRPQLPPHGLLRSRHRLADGAATVPTISTRYIDLSTPSGPKRSPGSHPVGTSPEAKGRSLECLLELATAGFRR